MKRKYKTLNKGGSALILAVVLTSLLAVIGVVFLLSSRVDSLATSGLSDQKDLNSAVETVVSKISQVLADDVPRSDPNGNKMSEYFDYPGDNDKWLACLEPDLSGRRKWRQISDIYNRFEPRDRELLFRGPDSIIAEYQEPGAVEPNIEADADGDGVADSRWVKVNDMTSSKGKEIYAAIRIIDNGAMLNVNTAYKFDPNDPGVNGENIDGTSQLQVNVMGLAGRHDSNNYDSEALQLWKLRVPNYTGIKPDQTDFSNYQRDVVWHYDKPDGVYTPFDISDELELRYRFLLNQEGVDTRLEPWGGEFRSSIASTPADDLTVWYERAYDSGSLNPRYAYRHIATTYNMDRIIAADGNSMVNINDVCDVNPLYKAVKDGLEDSNVVSPALEETAAQIAVNLIDYQDADSNVTPFDFDNDGIDDVYGFETPCIYISELAHRFVEYLPPGGGPSGARVRRRSYAIELYKPYPEDVSPPSGQWQVTIGSDSYPVVWPGTEQYHVIVWDDPCVPIEPYINSAASKQPEPPVPYPESIFQRNDLVRLERLVDSGWVTVDSVIVPQDAGGKWLVYDALLHSFQRDTAEHKCIRRSWDNALTKHDSETLGEGNIYPDGNPEQIQAHPSNEPFKNVGEIGMLFRTGAYYDDPVDQNQCVGYGTNKNEEAVRLNLQDPAYQNLFNYITVSSFYPPKDGIDNDGNGIIDEPGHSEWKIAGRININTAPWYVIAQLPWMRPEIAQQIVTDRDISLAGFDSIAELTEVINPDPNHSMDVYARDANDDLMGFPDLTPADDAINDFEERDVIFARISNLVTVRSDVFTAYILVRIGKDGPQKRVIAILDRSDVYKPGDKVKIVALQQVPDPR